MDGFIRFIGTYAWVSFFTIICNGGFWHILLEYVANFEQDAIHLFLTVFPTITLLQYIHGYIVTESLEPHVCACFTPFLVVYLQ